MHSIEFPKSRLTAGIVMIVALNKLRFKSRSRSSSLLDQMRDTMLKQRLYIFLNNSFIHGLQLEQEPLICIMFQFFLILYIKHRCQARYEM